ncbi:radical SAM family heme chaperone HemW [Anoxybacteroides amylolyticum]|uniref:Heme chaperone HemW n=1 Tax=Anoxybacteroides amylolyticum TaxID=294699 RepID=A0A167TLK5_9BACL|nr:radical SAM family heme chaperone HemW [Anoxybacillus amylolyticus]ANB61344.1 radical SAM superfamily protein [Anoxybacillus amylolyticus]
MIQAAYLHIPFCTHICHYCDFNKVFLKGQPVAEYLQAMEQEMKRTVAQFPAERVQTIFIGGGTPTALDIRQLDFLLENIHRYLPCTVDKVEFTVEANPNELSREKLQCLKDAGVNRLSIGVQTFNDTLLRRIGRTHQTRDVWQAVETAKAVGFTNISIDLIYGLPGQTLEQLQKDLAVAFSLDVPHISAYSLIIEPKTVFYNLMRKGKLSLPSQDEEAEMYEETMKQMQQHGYVQYELSNYARSGFESQHNLTYWNNEYYYGIGAGAHSYMNGIRNVNIGPVKKYIELIEKGQLPYVERHEVNERERMEEEMFLGLRKIEGVSKQRFYEKFHRSLNDVFGDVIAKEKANGLLEETETHVRLTHRGKLLGNVVFEAFLHVS